MRPPTPKQGQRVVFEKITFLWKRLNFSWKASVRNLVRYKKRFFMTIFGIGGCMGLMIVGFGLKDSIFAVVDIQYGEDVYKRQVLHRVMENSDHNSYVLCGDNQYRKEYGVQPEQILAALTGFYRGNQYIDCEKNKKYKQYVKLWCSPLFPRRCAVWAVKAVMKIRSRASKR